MTKKIIFIAGLTIAIILVAYLLTDKFGLFKVEFKQEWKSCNNDQECSLVSTPGCCSCGDGDAINSKFINEYNKYRRSNTGSCWRVLCSICPKIFRVARCVDNKCVATGWQTYRNKEYGFEVKYPLTLKLWENQQQGTAVYAVSFENPLSDSKLVGRKIVFNISIFSNTTQLQDAFSTNSDPYRLRIVQEETAVGGYQAQKILFKPKNPEDIEATVYLIAQKSTAITVFGTDLHKISEADINKILSTFRFIEQDETANWKAYRNEEYGFEVKYPDYYQILAPMKQFQERKSFDRSRSTKILLSLESVSSEFVPGLSYRATYPKLEIHVFELNSYLFSNPIAGTEYDYDPVKDQWQQWQMYDILKAKNLGIPDLETLTGDGWVGYKLGYGDAGFGYAAVAIPSKDKNIMLEIVNISDALTGEFPLNTILSTFKFTK